jgi:hypothetical protein
MKVYLPQPGPDFSQPEEAEIYKVPTPYVGIKYTSRYPSGRCLLSLFYLYSFPFMYSFSFMFSFILSLPPFFFDKVMPISLEFF